MKAIKNLCFIICGDIENNPDNAKFLKNHIMREHKFVVFSRTQGLCEKINCVKHEMFDEVEKIADNEKDKFFEKFNKISRALGLPVRKIQRRRPRRVRVRCDGPPLRHEGLRDEGRRHIRRCPHAVRLPRHPCHQTYGRHEQARPGIRRHGQELHVLIAPVRDVRPGPGRLPHRHYRNQIGPRAEIGL